MYIEKGKSIPESEIRDYLEKHYPEDIKRVSKKAKVTKDDVLQQATRELFLLNEAMLKNYEVWADCEKWPRGNLDTGKHWYQIWFLDLSKDGIPIRRHFWALLFMDRNPSSQGYGYGFSSGAIGMSRLQDATDHIFRILKNMGGCYGQL